MGADAERHYCNARRHGWADKLPNKREPGAWVGEGYCKREAGWGTDHFGTGRCRKHGGNSLAGPEHPRWTTGEYSKVIPLELRESWERHMNNPDKLALDKQIALLDSIEEWMLGKWGTGDSAQAWEEAQRAVVLLDKAVTRNDPALLNEARQQLSDAVRIGTEQHGLIRELRAHMKVRKELVSTDARRMVMAQEMVDRSTLTAFAVYLGDGFVRVIDDLVTDDELAMTLRRGFASYVRGVIERRQLTQ